MFVSRSDFCGNLVYEAGRHVENGFQKFFPQTHAKIMIEMGQQLTSETSNQEHEKFLTLAGGFAAGIFLIGLSFQAPKTGLALGACFFAYADMRIEEMKNPVTNVMREAARFFGFSWL